jgi:hypothetical protein
MTGCGACGEPITPNDAMAEVYDPNDPDETDIVHADCTPTGWEIA